MNSKFKVGDLFVFFKHSIGLTIGEITFINRTINKSTVIKFKSFFDFTDVFTYEDFEVESEIYNNSYLINNMKDAVPIIFQV